MGQLHETLAVLASSEKDAIDKFAEIKQCFNNGGLFQGQNKTLKMNDADRAEEEAPAAEDKPLQALVSDKIEDLSISLQRFMDIKYQQEATNGIAKADIVLPNDRVLAKNVPACMLLSMEKTLKKILDVYETIPILDTTKEWKEDTDVQVGQFSLKNPISTNKTEKIATFPEIAPATKEHKAQVFRVDKNVIVGTYTTHVFSGMITPARKKLLTSRIKRLDTAVKKARARANKTEIIDTKIGKQIFDYINE